MLSDQERQIIRNLGEIQDPLKLFDVLHAAKEKLLSELRSASRNTIKSSILRNVNKRNTSGGEGTELEMTGSRLAALSSLKSAARHVEELQANPFNSKARLELVEAYVKRGEEDHLILNRDAFLLALMEVEHQDPNTHTLRVASIAQKKYLDSLEAFLKAENAEVQDAAQNVDQIKEANRKLWYVSEMAKTFKHRTFKEDAEFHVNEILKTGRVKRDDIGARLAPLIEVLGNLPSATGSRERVMDVLGRVSSKHALAAHYQGQLLRKDARILMMRFKAGEKEKGPEVLSTLDSALVHARNSIKLMKGTTSRVEQALCIKEFGFLCLAVSQYYPMTGTNIRSEHVRLIETAARMLGMVSQDRGISELQKKLISSIQTFKKAAGKSSQSTDAEEEKSPKADARNKFFTREVPKEKVLGSNEDFNKPTKDFFEKPIPEDQF